MYINNPLVNPLNFALLPTVQLWYTNYLALSPASNFDTWYNSRWSKRPGNATALSKAASNAFKAWFNKYWSAYIVPYNYPTTLEDTVRFNVETFSGDLITYIRTPMVRVWPQFSNLPYAKFAPAVKAFDAWYTKYIKVYEPKATKYRF